MIHLCSRKVIVPKWRAIVFDLDDTLYPERDYVLSGFRAIARWAAEHLRIPAEDGYRELAELFAAGVRETLSIDG